MLFWLFWVLLKEKVSSWQNESLNGKDQIKFQEKRRQTEVPQSGYEVLVFFYQGVNEVKILKRSAKAKSLHAQRAELALQEYCTQSRIGSKDCMMLLQTELMKKCNSTKHRPCQWLGGLPFISEADYTSLSFLYQLMWHTSQSLMPG